MGLVKRLQAFVDASKPFGLLAQTVHKCILLLMCRPGGFDALSD